MATLGKRSPKTTSAASGPAEVLRRIPVETLERYPTVGDPQADSDNVVAQLAVDRACAATTEA